MAARVPRRRSPGQTRGMTPHRLGGLSVLMPSPPPPATALARCLETLKQQWQRDGSLAGLWQRWPALAGAQLAPHCRPLRLQGSVLTVGAAPGPWLQALQYNRHQLLASLRAAGFPIRDVRVVQHRLGTLTEPDTVQEASFWDRHPSRVDVHGLGICAQCRSPAPRGELALWGECSFCRRQTLSGSQGESRSDQ